MKYSTMQNTIFKLKLYKTLNILAAHLPLRLHNYDRLHSCIEMRRLFFNERSFALGVW